MSGRSNKGATAFLGGFLIAAAPLTYWMLGLTAGTAEWKFTLAIVVEFLAGFGARALYLRYQRNK